MEIKETMRVLCLDHKFTTFWGRELAVIEKALLREDQAFECSICEASIEDDDGVSYKTVSIPTKVFCSKCVEFWTATDVLSKLHNGQAMRRFIVEHFSQVPLPGTENFDPDNLIAALEAKPDAFASVCRQATVIVRTQKEASEARAEISKTLSNDCGIQLDEGGG